MVSRIDRGEHLGASGNTKAMWAGRLVSSSKLLSLKEQRALLALTSECRDPHM